MTLLRTILVALVACTGAAAATPAEPTDLVVTDFRWGKVVSKVVITDRGPVTVDPDVRIRAPRPGMAPPTIILQREAYVLVKNTGTRTVSALEYSFVFYADAEHHREVGRFHFRSKDTVKPGEMKFVSESVKEAAPTAFVAVVLENVDYKDASK